MSEGCDTDGLRFGSDPGDLVFDVVPNRALTAQLVLKENGVPIAWPSQPVLWFREDLEVTATLEDYTGTDPDTVDALASWTMSAEQTATLNEYDPVELRLDGEPLFKGVVSCH